MARGVALRKTLVVYFCAVYGVIAFVIGVMVKQTCCVFVFVATCVADVGVVARHVPGVVRGNSVAAWSRGARVARGLWRLCGW